MENYDQLCQTCSSRSKLEKLNLARIQEIDTWSSNVRYSDGMGHIVMSKVLPEAIERCNGPTKPRGFIGSRMCGAGLSIIMVGKSDEICILPERYNSLEEIKNSIDRAEKTRQSPLLPVGNYKEKLPIHYLEKRLFTVTQPLMGQCNTMPGGTQIASGEVVRTDIENQKPFSIFAMGYPDANMFYAHELDVSVDSTGSRLGSVALGLYSWLNAGSEEYRRNIEMLP